MSLHSHALLAWQVDDTYVLSVELGSVPDDEEQEVSVARCHTGHVSDTHVDAVHQCQYFDNCLLNVSTSRLYMTTPRSPTRTRMRGLRHFSAGSAA